MPLGNYPIWRQVTHLRMNWERRGVGTGLCLPGKPRSVALASSKCDSLLFTPTPPALFNGICPGTLEGRKEGSYFIEGGRAKPLASAWHQCMPCASWQRCVATAITLWTPPAQGTPAAWSRVFTFLTWHEHSSVHPWQGRLLSWGHTLAHQRLPIPSLEKLGMAFQTLPCKAAIFTVTCFLKLLTEVIPGNKKLQVFSFPSGWRELEGDKSWRTWLWTARPILLSGWCSMPALPAHLKLWTATCYNLINRKNGLCYSSFTPAHLVWYGTNMVISLSRVYVKVPDMFPNDRPGIYFLSLICIYLQLI